MPPQVAERIYPAGGEKLNPAAREALEKAAKDRSGEEGGVFTKIEQAEAQGAAWSFRWTTVMPCVLIVIFGLIALVDKMRGGYRAGSPDHRPGRAAAAGPRRPRRDVAAGPTR